MLQLCELLLKLMMLLGVFGVLTYDPDVPGHEQTTPEMITVYGIGLAMIAIPALVQWACGWGWFDPDDDPPSSDRRPRLGPPRHTLR